MSKIFLSFCIIAMAFVVCGFLVLAQDINDNWSRLNKDMKQDEVLKIFGRPQRIVTGAVLSFWYYPQDRQIVFDDRGKIVGWSQP